MIVRDRPFRQVLVRAPVASDPSRTSVAVVWAPAKDARAGAPATIETSEGSASGLVVEVYAQIACYPCDKCRRLCTEEARSCVCEEKKASKAPKEK